MIVTLLSSMSPFILTALAAPGNEAAGTDMDEPFNILVAHYFRDGQISAPLYCTQPGDAKGKKRLRSGSESVVQDAEGGQREIKRSKSEDPVKKKNIRKRKLESSCETFAVSFANISFWAKRRCYSEFTAVFRRDMVFSC